jgi:hypothetical protein
VEDRLLTGSKSDLRFLTELGPRAKITVTTLEASFVRHREHRDHICVIRQDGSTCDWAFLTYEDQFPHELCHLVVEEGLQFAFAAKTLARSSARDEGSHSQGRSNVAITPRIHGPLSMISVRTRRSIRNRCGPVAGGSERQGRSRLGSTH